MKSIPSVMINISFSFIIKYGAEDLINIPPVKISYIFLFLYKLFTSRDFSLKMYIAINKKSLLYSIRILIRPINSFMKKVL